MCSDVFSPCDLCCRRNDIIAELSQLLHSCSHATLEQLLQPLLLPCLSTIVESAQSQPPGNTASAPKSAVHHNILEAAAAASEIQMRGSAWVMLGMLRLHLAAPPAGADPVGKYAFKKAHVERVLNEDVMPETEVGLFLVLCCPVQTVTQ